MLVLDEDTDVGATEEFDMVAIRKAKDTLLSIEEEVIDYDNDEDEKEEERIELPDEFVGCEPELLPVGLE